MMPPDKRSPRLGTGGEGDAATARPLSYESIAPRGSPVNARCFLCGEVRLAHVCTEQCLNPFRLRHSYAELAAFGSLGFCESCAGIVGALPLGEAHYRPPPQAQPRRAATPPPAPARPPVAKDGERRCWEGVRIP